MSRTTKKEQQNSKWHIVNGQLWAWWYLCHISLPLWFSSHHIFIECVYIRSTGSFVALSTLFFGCNRQVTKIKTTTFQSIFFVSIDFFQLNLVRTMFFYLNLIQFQWIFLNNLNNFPSFWWSALHRISNFRSIALKSIVEFYEPNIF